MTGRFQEMRVRGFAVEGGRRAAQAVEISACLNLEL